MLNPAAWVRTLKLNHRARRLAQAAEQCADLGQVLDLVAHRPFKAAQKRGEIIPFLARVQALGARTLCEIGARHGGNLVLFARAAADDARILSIDIELPPPRRRAHSRFARAQQAITCLEADSHQPRTREAVEQWLGADRLDVLFIDGDHSYRGVSEDFAMYSPLVRPGGLIAFHDIVADHTARGIAPTGSWAGDVPRFWREIAPRFPEHWEFVEDPGQDGYGIGVIRWPG